MPRRPSQWQPDQDLSIGRLAWLAAFPELHRRSAPWWAAPFQIAAEVAPALSAFRGGFPPYGRNTGPELGVEATSDRMASYAEPVDTVAARLNVDEQKALRDNGTLPDWFFDAVQQERKADRRSRR